MMTDFKQLVNENLQPANFVKTAMKITTVSAFCFLLLFVQDASAQQQKLSSGQGVIQNIEPGKTHAYSISLNDGDYVGASITLHGKVNMFILYPDGSVMRRLLVDPPRDAKIPFAFAAEGTGVYSI